MHDLTAISALLICKGYKGRGLTFIFLLVAS